MKLETITIGAKVGSLYGYIPVVHIDFATRAQIADFLVGHKSGEELEATLSFASSKRKS